MRMRDIDIEEKFHQELLKNIKTSLIHTGIEILEYSKEGQSEFLKLLFPFTTTGNILTYQYNELTDELLLVDMSVYIINEDKINEYEDLVDRDTIMKLYSYCRKQLKEYIDKRMEQIYNMIIDGVPLTEITLINKGFTKEEITTLFKEGILKVTEREEYALSSTDKFYRYGIKLLLTDEFEKANICFRKCHQIDPNNRDICLQLLYRQISQGNYTESFEIFSHIETITSEEKRNDNNLYLYILSQLTKCPEQYDSRIKHMKVSDVFVLEDNSNRDKENKIREAIMKNKYKYALNLLNDILATKTIYNVQYALLKELLIQLITYEEKFKLRLSNFVRTKKYVLIIQFLTNKNKKRKLYNTEQWMLMISRDILNILNTRIIPTETVTHTESVYVAIKGKNYKLAKELNINFLKRNRMSITDDLVDILLTDIIKLISRIKEGSFNIPNLEDIEKHESYESNEDQVIKFIQDIAYYINAERLSLEEATVKYSLTKEQVQLIKLIYARDYYIEGLYHKGDTLRQEVETSEDNSSRVISFLNEIKTNRMLYMNDIKPYARRKEKKSIQIPNS